MRARADAVEATILAMERVPAGSVLNVGGGEAAERSSTIDDVVEEADGLVRVLVVQPVDEMDLGADRQRRSRPVV
jgi:hypothetical protein